MSRKPTKKEKQLTQEQIDTLLVKQKRTFKNQRRMSRRLLYLLVGLTVAVPFTSPHFRVRHVDIVGVHSALTPAETETLKQSLTTSKYTNWLRAPVTTLAQNTLKLPTIEKVNVSRKWGWKLVAEVKPRMPHAILSVNGAKYEMDEKGFLIRPARDPQIVALPQVEFPAIPNLRLGQQMGVYSCASWLSLLNNRYANNTVRIEKIVVDYNGNLCLNMSDKLEVRLGQYLPLTNQQTDSFEFKLNRLKVMYERKPAIANEVLVVNLSAPQYPSYLPRPSATGTNVPNPTENSTPKQG